MAMKLEDFEKIMEAFPNEITINDKVIYEGLGWFCDTKEASYEYALITAFRRFVSKFPIYYL